MARVLAFILLLILAASPVAAADNSLDRIAAARVLRVGIAANMPWVVKTAAGEWVGYDVDLARELAADLGVEVRFVEMPFSDLVPRLAHGDVDLVAAGLAITPGRARAVAFSNPIGSAAIRVVASRVALGNDAAKALGTPGFTIAALAGSTDAAAARASFPTAKIVEYPSATDALAALLAGTTQAMVATAPVPRLTATLYDAKFQLLRRPLTHTPEAFAIRDDDGRLLVYVNNWIAAKTADGTIAAADDHWFGHMTWLRELERDTPATSK